MTPAAPLFLHSEWRTGSTYVWNLLGRTDGAMGFYEPFHECLATLDEASMPDRRPDTWASGHGASPQPYFLEYAPLLARSGGVMGFRSSFSYSDYYALDDERTEPQRAYLRGLLDLAADRGRRPVLGFCRSLGRVPWLREAFPDAVHVWLRRDPVSQWLSGWQIWRDQHNPYFVAGYPLIAALAADHPYLAEVVAEHQVPAPPLGHPWPFGVFGEWAAEQSAATLFALFCHVHCVNEQRAEGCDVVVEVDRLSDRRYASRVAARLARHGVRVGFEDAAMPARRAEGDLADALTEVVAAVRARVADRVAADLPV